MLSGINRIPLQSVFILGYSYFTMTEPENPKKQFYRPAKDLQEAEKEAIFIQSLAGRPRRRISKTFKVSLRTIRGVNNEKLQGRARRGKDESKCVNCPKKAQQGDIFCGRKCHESWTQKHIERYFEKCLCKN